MIITPQEVGTVGFIGAGHIGSTLARLFANTGRDVVVSNSRDPQTLAELVAGLGPRARAATPAQAAAAGDVVVVTVPFKAIRALPVESLADTIVIDTNNYYPDRDGSTPALDAETTTSSEVLQQHLPAAHVVKAFNTIYFQHLATQGRPAGAGDRRALPIAGNAAEAKNVVAALIDDLGFDVVDAGPLAEGWRFQPDTPAYVVHAGTADLTARLARAKRRRDTTPEEARQIATEARAAFAN